MKTLDRMLVVTCVVVLSLGWGQAAFGDIPLMINHQGLIKVAGGPFTGTGEFKFGFVDSSGNWLWTNDGTHVGESAGSTSPDQAIVLSVSYGVYNVQLGDTSISNMVAIPSSVFDSDDVDLRVMFNYLVLGWETLLPDQRITSGAYAYPAATADTAVTADNAIPSIFGIFCGDGSDGDVTVSSSTNFSTLTGSVDDWYLETTSFTLDAGRTLTVDTGWAYIGVQGTCTINGTIDADGQGGIGGSHANDDHGYCGANAEGFGGGTAYGQTDTVAGGNVVNGVVVTGTISTQFSVGLAVSGAGGGGGSGGAGGTYYGGAGGGAGAPGGGGGISGAAGGDAMATPANKIRALTGGSLGNNSAHGYSHFMPLIVKFRGAGGGSGGMSLGDGAGGNGGGVICIECDNLVFDGVLLATGDNGQAGVADRGAGGGGGGGVILVRAKSITTNTGTVSVAGGAGGAPGGWIGGSGADGFKDIIQVK